MYIYIQKVARGVCVVDVTETGCVCDVEAHMSCQMPAAPVPWRAKRNSAVVLAARSRRMRPATNAPEGASGTSLCLYLISNASPLPLLHLRSTPSSAPPQPSSRTASNAVQGASGISP